MSTNYRRNRDAHTDEQLRRMDYTEALAWLADLHDRVSLIRDNPVVKDYAADDHLNHALKHVEAASTDVSDGLSKEAFDLPGDSE